MIFLLHSLCVLTLPPSLPAQVDSMQPVEFQAFLEGFTACQICTVSLIDVGVVQSMILEDPRGKPLRLTITLEALGGTAMKVRHDCDGLANVSVD